MSVENPAALADTYGTYAQTDITLARRSRVVATATTVLRGAPGATGWSEAVCAMAHGTTASPSQYFGPNGVAVLPPDTADTINTMWQTVAETGAVVLDPGTYRFVVRCIKTTGSVSHQRTGLTLVAAAE